METAEEYFEATNQSTRLTKRQFGRVVLLVSTFLVLLGVSLAWYWNTTLKQARMEQEHEQGAAILADTYGIQFTLIGISQTSGFIELRYTVMDPDKALDINHYVELYPKLIAEKNGKVLLAPQVLKHEHNLEAGRSYYFFINNQHGTLSPGDLVTIQVGDVQVKHFKAQ